MQAVSDAQATTRAKRSKSGGKPKVEKVPVPCCSCGNPTGLKVPKTLLDEIEVFELCKGCR